MELQPQAMGSEKRRYQRVPYSERVVVVTTEEVETLPARDIGAGGLFLYANKAPRVGSRVKVEFVLGKGEHFSILGRVTRSEAPSDTSRRPGFAVEFEIPEEMRQKLAHSLLSRRSG